MDRTATRRAAIGLLILVAPTAAFFSCETADRGPESASRTEASARERPRPRRYEIPGVSADAATPENLRPEPERIRDAGPSEAVDRREVEFPAEDRRLAGTLYLPERAGVERVPGIVLVHDSGPLSRDAAMSGQFITHFGFDVLVFRDLANRLAAAGYAVLTYDKRTCGGDSNPRCAENENSSRTSVVTLDRLLRDASRAVSWLRDHDATDPRRLIVVGHGQGGTMVPKLMRENPEIVAGVLAATPHRSVDELYRLQAKLLRSKLEKYGRNEEQIRSHPVMQRIDGVADRLERLREERLDAERIAGVHVDYWRSWMRLGDAAPDLAAKLDRPLLVVGGRYDYNVPPAETERWRRTLGPNAEGAGHRIELFDCVTHALNCIEETKPMRAEPEDVGRHVHGPVTALVVEFLREVAGPGERAAPVPDVGSEAGVPSRDRDADVSTPVPSRDG